MKILLCSVPDGSLKVTVGSLLPRGAGFKFNFYSREIPSMLIPTAPIGVLRVISWMEKNGYHGEIYDINNLRPKDEELIKTFKQIKPTVVGLSGILSYCYPNIKRIAKLLRQLFPNVWIVVGGHITASSNLILRKTETDICVVGDGEIPFVKILDYIKLHPARRQLDYTALSQIKGLAFIDENNNLKVTGYSEQLPASELQYPDYDKLKESLQKYGGKGEWIHEFFEPLKNSSDIDDLCSVIKDITNKQMKDAETHQDKICETNIDSFRNKKMGEIHTSRGCVARCTFCQRGVKGYRTYAANDLENHILELKEKYNVGCLHPQDENALSNKKQAYEVARIMKKCGVFWKSGGVRCTSVNYEDLKFFKEHNLISISFGIESGSQQMLDIMEKKFTKEDVYNRISECHELGIINNPSGIIVGMPGETEHTMKETGEFLASMRYLKDQDWNVNLPLSSWAVAMPGTPLYEYCQQNGLIGKTLDEQEEYLLRITDEKLSFLNYINTTELSIEEVYYWNYLLHFSGKYAFKDLIIKSNKSVRNRMLQIYERCAKVEFNAFINSLSSLFRLRSTIYKGKLLKILIIIMNHLFVRLMHMGILFLPKAVLLPIVRAYSNLRFYFIKKKYKVKNGKQKYNIFMEQNADIGGKFKATQSRIDQANRKIERSLRTIVNDNRKQTKSPITNEEKSLEILATGQ